MKELLEKSDQQILNALQSGFPLVSRPFLEMSENLETSEEDVIRRIWQLKEQGIVRQIGPLFEARKIGFTTTLVAAKAPEAEFERAVHAVTSHPGVSHAYERNNDFNIWFTLAVPVTLDIEAELQRMFEGVKIDAVYSMPALKLFKLRTFFDTSGEGQPEDTAAPEARIDTPKLSEADKKVINAIQADLPLVAEPFRDMAAGAGMSQDEFLERARDLLERGIIRRFSASINHRRVGYTANGMACWVVPSERVDEIGNKLAALREVSHCYERKTNPRWDYNLFAMIHCPTREECLEIAKNVSVETGLPDHQVLFSTREFKKQRVQYLL